jgi:UDP-N-acetylmuramate: L-alanyl-gamma-D-glutamyl-meso-diaminopimelate ligase
MKNYAGSLNEADTAVVFMDKQAFELKQKEMPEEQLVQEAFNCPGLEIVRNPNELLKLIQAKIKKPAVILMMSSGSWGGMDLNTIGESLS